jgi:hemerythrin-like domain-containing protein
MENTITKLMLKEHDKIDKLLNLLNKELNNNSENSYKIFNRLKWIIDKHFFVEEKVLFSVYENNSNEDNMDILRLLKEHKDIYWLLNKIEDSFESKTKIDLSGLRRLIKSHASFEDINFYPKLDKELKEEQKQLIFSRTEEIINE